MSIKEYPVAAHLINSRLQLIRKQIKWHCITRPEELVEVNFDYFTKVVQSISRRHGINCKRSDLLYAAHMFLISTGIISEKGRKVVMYGAGKLGRPVTTPDNGITILPADSEERLGEKEALERLKQLQVHHGIAFFSIRVIYAYEEYHA